MFWLCFPSGEASTFEPAHPGLLLRQNKNYLFFLHWGAAGFLQICCSSGSTMRTKDESRAEKAASHFQRRPFKASARLSSPLWGRAYSFLCWGPCKKQGRSQRWRGAPPPPPCWEEKQEKQTAEERGGDTEAEESLTFPFWGCEGWRRAGDLQEVFTGEQSSWGQ